MRNTATIDHCKEKCRFGVSGLRQHHRRQCRIERAAHTRLVSWRRRNAGSNRQSAMIARTAPEVPTLFDASTGITPVRRPPSIASVGQIGRSIHTPINGETVERQRPVDEIFVGEEAFGAGDHGGQQGNVGQKLERLIRRPRRRSPINGRRQTDQAVDRHRARNATKQRTQPVRLLQDQPDNQRQRLRSLPESLAASRSVERISTMPSPTSRIRKTSVLK